MIPPAALNTRAVREDDPRSYPIRDRQIKLQHPLLELPRDFDRPERTLQAAACGGDTATRDRSYANATISRLQGREPTDHSVQTIYRWWRRKPSSWRTYSWPASYRCHPVPSRRPARLKLT